MKNNQTASAMPIHKYRPYHEMLAVDLPDRTWPSKRITAGPALVRRRPARRQPGAHRPDEPRAQAHHVRPAGAHGLQGDRGRIPVGEPDRLRLRAQPDRREPDPRRRDHPGAHPGAGNPDQPHLRVDRRREAGDRAPLQLDERAAARCRVPHRQAGHHRHRPRGRPPLQGGGEDHPRDRGLLRVLAGELHRHRARVRARRLQPGDRGLRADARPQGHHQPAGDGRDGDPERLRRLDRVDVAPPRPPRERAAQPAPAQRPRHGRRGCRAGLHGRRRPHRGMPVRQR